MKYANKRELGIEKLNRLKKHRSVSFSNSKVITKCRHNKCNDQSLLLLASK